MGKVKIQNMKIIEKYSTLFQEQPNTVTYWDQVEANKASYAFPTVTDALNELQNTPKTIYSTAEFRISAYYKNRKNLPNLKIIKSPELRYFGLIFPKNSPIAPIFKQFGAQIFENGFYHQQMKKVYGNGVPALNLQFKDVLTLGHVKLCFILFVSLIILTILLLGAEWIYKNYFFRNPIQIGHHSFSRTLTLTNSTIMVSETEDEQLLQFN